MRGCRGGAHTGAQATAKTLFYAPLPDAVQTKVDATLKGLQCEGKTIL